MEVSSMTHKHSAGINAIKQAAPSYLREVLNKSSVVILVYCEETKREDSNINNNEENKLITFESGNDLTGNPLKLELGADDTMMGEISENKQPNNWCINESRQLPISLYEARRYLNKNLSRTVGEENCPMYCVLNGKDSQQTILLGGLKSESQMMSTLVYIVGYYHKENRILRLQNMKKEHMKNLGISPENIQYSTRKVFNIYGYKQPDGAMVPASRYNGCFLIQSLQGELSLEELKADNTTFEAIIQVIPGHRNSKIYYLWQELNIVQINIAQLEERKDDENIVLSEDYIECDYVTQDINNLLNSATYGRYKTKHELDIKNLRLGTVLDEIWLILKNCKDLIDLRDCLHYLFKNVQRIASKIYIPDNNMSHIGIIIKDLQTGVRAHAPLLSLKESLELLLDLGIEILKDDYLCITNHYYVKGQQDILKLWNSFQKVNEADRKVEATDYRSCNTNPKIDINTTNLKAKLLLKLHNAVEFLVFMEDHSLSIENYHNFCKHVYKKHIFEDSNLSKSNVLQTSCALDIVDTFLDGKSVSCWSVQMTSKIPRGQVTTIFHAADYKIFPTTIFDDYDCSLNDEDSYYVTKLVERVQVI